MAHFRSVIETEKGSVARGAQGWQAVSLNDKNMRIRVSAFGDKNGASRAAIEVAKVLYISATGASCEQVTGLYLTEQDLENLRTGKARLAIVSTGV
jgi:hypothetical protein